jgi:tetratricopeptide (TPR) repeat protein
VLEEMSEMQRRRFIRSAGQAAAYLLATKFPTGQHGLLGAEHLDLAAARLDRLRRLDGRDGADAVVVSAVEQADHLFRLLKGTPAAAPLRGRLALLAGEAATLAGWSSLNIGEPAPAMSWFRVAEACGEQGAYADLQAWGVRQQAHLLDLAGKHEAALGRLRRAPLESASAPVRIEVELLRARTAAKLPDGRRDRWALAALARAEATLDHVARDPSPLGWMWLVTDSLVAAQRGHTLMLLGQGEAAYEHLTTGLRSHPKALYRGFGELHLDLGRAAALAGEPEAACDHLAQADEVFGAIGATRQAGLLREVRGRDLAAFADTAAVRDLDERLRDGPPPIGGGHRYVTVRSYTGRRRLHQADCSNLRRAKVSRADPWPAGAGREPGELAADPHLRPGLDVCGHCMLRR